MPIVVDIPGAGQAESLILDGLDLNDGAAFRTEAFEIAPAKKRPDFVGSANSDGQALLQDPYADNLTATLRLRIPTQATMDQALANIRALIGKLDEASRATGGIPLVNVPQNATVTGTLYVLMGEITGLPRALSGADTGWFQRSPVITVTLTCKPYLYGATQTFTGTTSSAALATLEVPGVKGDVPAEATLTVTDNATQARRHVEWGLEQRDYNPATSLLIDSATMVIAGFAGANVLRSGVLGGTVIRATMTRQPQAICGTGQLAHVGTFRAKAQVYAGTDTQVRLSYRVGSGEWASTDYVTAVADDKSCELDFGVITLAGPSWEGRIDAFAATVGDTIDIDALYLIPVAAGYGKARAVYTYTPGVVVGHDEFTATTAGSNLQARNAPAGGTWATSGATTDFTFADDIPTTNEYVRRLVTDAFPGSPRIALLGTTTYTDVEVGVAIDLQPSPPKEVYARAIARNGASGYAYAEAGNYYMGATLVNVLTVGIFNGTSDEKLSTVIVPTRPFTVKIVVYATGRAVGMFYDAGGALITSLSAVDSRLATGGTLATGKVGFSDYMTTAPSDSNWLQRIYDNFYVATPAAEPLAIYASKRIEFRSDDTQRADSSNVMGRPQQYRGARFFLPPAGPGDLTSRLAVKARRNDVETTPDANLTDSITIALQATPRYRIVSEP